MRRIGLLILALALASALIVVIHLGWHFAMPRDHAFALHWPLHWILPALSFFAVGGIIARVWGGDSVRVAAAVALLAVLVAQVVLPVLEVAVREQRLGFGGDPMRWKAFLLYVGIGLPALFAAARLLRPRAGTGRSTSRPRFTGRSTPLAP